MKLKFRSLDFPVYIFFTILAFCKGIDLTKDSKIYIILYVVGIMLLTIRLFKQKYNLKQIFLIFIMMIISILILLIGHNSTPLFFTIAVCSLKDTNLNKILKLIFYVHFVSFVTMIFLSSIGIIENHYILHMRNNIGLTKRYFFGYLHPNLVQTHLLSLIILYYYLYGEKSNYIISIFWFLFSCILFKFTYSRTSFVLSIMFIILFMITRNKPKLKKFIAFFGKYSFVILFVFTIFLSITYKSSNFTKKIDDILTGRIYYLNYVYTNYNVPIIGYSNYGEKIAIDNSYFSLLYQSGVAFTLIIFLLNLYIAKKKYDEKDYDFLIIMLFINLLCFTENLYLVPTINFLSLIMMSNIIKRLDKGECQNESNNINSNV